MITMTEQRRNCLCLYCGHCRKYHRAGKDACQLCESCKVFI